MIGMYNGNTLCVLYIIKLFPMCTQCQMFWTRKWNFCQYWEYQIWKDRFPQRHSQGLGQSPWRCCWKQRNCLYDCDVPDMFQLSFQSPLPIIYQHLSVHELLKELFRNRTSLLLQCYCIACLLKNWCSLGSSCLVFAQLVSQSVLVEQVTFFGPHAPPGTCSLMATLCFFTQPADDEV